MMIVIIMVKSVVFTWTDVVESGVGVDWDNVLRLGKDHRLRSRRCHFVGLNYRVEGALLLRESLRSSDLHRWSLVCP